jgi:hypothetical protein
MDWRHAREAERAALPAALSAVRAHTIAGLVLIGFPMADPALRRLLVLPGRRLHRSDSRNYQGCYRPFEQARRTTASVHANPLPAPSEERAFTECKLLNSLHMRRPMPGARFFTRSDRPPQDGLRREDASLVTRAVRPRPATIATRSICPSSRLPLRQMACKMTILVALHRQHAVGMTTIKADDGQTKLAKLAPQPG